MSKEAQAHIDKAEASLSEVKKVFGKIPEIKTGKKPAKLDPKLLKAMADLAKEEAKLAKSVAALATSANGIIPTALKEHKSVLKAVQASLSAQIKAYQKAVKDSDGLTSVRPATVKALDKLTKDPGPEVFKTALKELEAHSADVSKKYGKDKAKKQAVADFKKAIDKLSATLSKK